MHTTEYKNQGFIPKYRRDEEKTLRWIRYFFFKPKEKKKNTEKRSEAPKKQKWWACFFQNRILWASVELKHNHLYNHTAKRDSRSETDVKPPQHMQEHIFTSDIVCVIIMYNVIIFTWYHKYSKWGYRLMNQGTSHSLYV